MCAQKYIRICNSIFNTHKVLNVKIRNSYFYWTNPYIMEIEYSKRWTETYYVNVGSKNTSYSVPIQEHHESADYAYKYKEYSEIMKIYNEFKFKCSNAQCINAITKKID